MRRINDKADEDTLARWLATYAGVIERISRVYSRSDAERDDLRQEIHLALWRSIPSFRGDASEATWIYRVALNVALSAERRRPPDAEHDVVDELPHPTDDRDEQRQWLFAKLRELTPAQRSLAVLVLDGHRYADIAEILGISESNVGVRVNRLKKHLRNLLKEEP